MIFGVSYFSHYTAFWPSGSIKTSKGWDSHEYPT